VSRIISDDRTTGTVLDANGQPSARPTTILTADEAALLRAYKKFLQKHGIRDASYCASCFSGNRHDGMQVRVTDAEIIFICRCRMLYHLGQTF
jgi:hypothetical protein